MPIQSKQQPPYYQTGINPKTYKALVSQLGTDPPTLIILQNTIGEIVWTRNQMGVYYGTLTGAFPLDKTIAILTPSSGADITISCYAIRQSNDIIKIVTGTGSDLIDEGLIQKSTLIIQTF